MSSDEYVAILDAGSQFGKVIDRKVRELKVDTRILPLDTPTATLRDDPNLKAVIISGGPSSVYAADAPAFHADLFLGLKKPILGICYGMQLMTTVLNGSIQRKSIREDGQETIELETTSPLFKGLSATEKVLLTHGDSVENAGPELKVIARSSASRIIAAVEHRDLPLFGVQFHPEVDLTEGGVQMFKNFLTLAQFSFSFTMEDRETVAIRHIREKTQDGQKVLCLASGGVDSTVCAALLLKALGPERVICVHIDHGFMRAGESESVVKALSDAGVKLCLVDASKEFREASTTMPSKGGKPSYTTQRLDQCTAPEEKRIIIGNTFMSICDSVVKKLHLDMDHLLLAQGTLRPDLIESGSHMASKKADAIKTHHNDTEVVRALREQGKIVEPLSDYHKDEVRELGRSLGLSDDLVMRQPFPGPGLAIRILCTEQPALGDDFEATGKLVNALHETQIEESQSPVIATASTIIKTLGLRAIVLPIRSVGVQGDGRTYSNAVALSCLKPEHKEGFGLTSQEWVELLKLARLIPQFAHKVNRVVFMFGSPVLESPTVITPTTLSLEAIDRIRQADSIVNNGLKKHTLLKKLSQVPVVLVPVGFENQHGHSVVIRTFLTNDFMTGIPATPGTEYFPMDALHEIVTELRSKLSWFLGRVMFDLTAKPPGTTEWE